MRKAVILQALLCISCFLIGHMFSDIKCVLLERKNGLSPSPRHNDESIPKDIYDVQLQGGKTSQTQQ